MADISERLRPEVVARWREILKEVAGLQGEASRLIFAEVERLSKAGEDPEAVQFQIAQFYNALALGAFTDEAQLLNSPES